MTEQEKRKIVVKPLGEGEGPADAVAMGDGHMTGEPQHREPGASHKPTD
ncbi:hypothetical protein WDH52_13005 [Streptomyces sp. TRM70308]|nr:hypothetical protein [Streptomyces sp. JHD 1]MCX2968262.1 hypothetical protein [Streptomyces sp. JHD 1]